MVIDIMERKRQKEEEEKRNMGRFFYIHRVALDYIMQIGEFSMPMDTMEETFCKRCERIEMDEAFKKRAEDVFEDFHNLTDEQKDLAKYFTVLGLHCNDKTLPREEVKRSVKYATIAFNEGRFESFIEKSITGKTLIYAYEFEESINAPEIKVLDLRPDNTNQRKSHTRE